MQDLDADLDDAAAAGGPAARRRPLRAALVLPVALGLAAGLVAVGTVVVPRLVPGPVPPDVNVDDVTGLVDPGHPVVDLHEDADGRPVGAATVTIQVVLRVDGVPKGLHGSVRVAAPIGPGIGPAGPSGLTVPATVGSHTLGGLTFPVTCEGLGGSARYAVPVTYGRDDARALATGTLREGLRDVVGQVCAARSLRSDLRVTAVDPVPDRAAVRLTVENRGTRPATLDWAFGRPLPQGQAPPGTSSFDVPTTRTTCVEVGVGPDGRTTNVVSMQSTDVGLGLLGGVPPRSGGPLRLSPVAFSAAAKESFVPAVRQACKNRD